MPLTIYAKVKANGTAWSGDVTHTEVAGVDVSADCNEVYALNGGVGTGAERQSSGRITAHASVRPFVADMRLDQTAPLAWQALARNETMEVQFLVFDNATEVGGDGATRHRFSIHGTGGRVVDVGIESPSTLHPEHSSHPTFMRVAFVFHTIRIVDEVNSAEFEHAWSQQT